MAVDKKIFVTAGIITIVLFGLIYIANQLLNNQRETELEQLRDEVIDELENMKAFTAISGLIGEEDNCDILQAQLYYFDESVWDLGKKLDSYEEASRNIFVNPYYKQQKKRFVVNELLYLSMLEKMKQTCNSTTPVSIIYFYANAKDCPDCDAQAFVLTDINNEIDEELAIFSLDSDLDLIATNVLAEYYNISYLPCIVIEDNVYCGLQDKKTIINYMCEEIELELCS